ncbi:hypothetical protein MXB_3040, partial [Myxobolus squamalis]
MSGSILITGGAGFVGSHTLVELIKSGYDCIVLDNFSNSTKECITQCEKIVGKSIKSVFKSVGESVEFPLRYYHNNITGSINLLRAMQEFKVSKIVFSSSATVYGSPKYLPIDESHPIGDCSNPYGITKFFIEKIIEDHIKSINGSYIHLRYFNPVGASESGIIGETPTGVPNNLFPYIADVAAGQRPEINVFGDDYDTIDGTGVRDYIHIVDLAKGHTQAIKLITSTCAIQKVYNLGTGQGYSVIQVIEAYEKACGKPIPYRIVGRRPGDVA